MIPHDLVVDGIHYDGPHVRVQPLVQIKPEQPCGCPDSCAFDFQAKRRDPHCEDSGLPSPHTCEAYLWQTGDPIYTGRAS